MDVTTTNTAATTGSSNEPGYEDRISFKVNNCLLSSYGLNVAEVFA